MVRCMPTIHRPSSKNRYGMSNILSNKIYYGTFSRFGVEYPNHTIPIITKDLYDKANQELKSHASRIRHKYLYKGLVVCKGCS